MVTSLRFEQQEETASAVLEPPQWRSSLPAHPVEMPRSGDVEASRRWSCRRVLRRCRRAFWSIVFVMRLPALLHADVCAQALRLCSDWRQQRIRAISWWVFGATLVLEGILLSLWLYMASSEHGSPIRSDIIVSMELSYSWRSIIGAVARAAGTTCISLLLLVHKATATLLVVLWQTPWSVVALYAVGTAWYFLAEDDD